MDIDTHAQSKAIEHIASAIGVTAPLWVTVISDLNAVLGLVSALLSIAFVIWQWRRSARRYGPPTVLGRFDEEEVP